ncbi:carboxypeptidase M32 [Ideonella livida]|uniref:Metal-dependent carboxypeptidase n=1 Tax=Ideonella livida TaxID=2707176 RepID=A0A7C9TLI2_9BURK|nr:carboxypeptidase M32 [Ideonella livida]NDY92303.1 carboxypeptidase M32 [Ideonella livida]
MSAHDTTPADPLFAATPAYGRLHRLQSRLHRLNHLVSIAHWDQAAMMPAGGHAARSAALAELQTQIHREGIAPEVGHWLAQAADEPLDDWQRANWREIDLQWRRARALPDALVERRSQLASACEHAWRQQRPANDWQGFVQQFKPLLAVVREEAALLSDHLGLSPYDTQLQQFEPGARSQDIARVFDEVRTWLPGLIQAARERQAAEPVPVAPQGPFPVAAQQALGLDVVRWLGFDLDAGRLDVSTHPFTGGVPEDVRLTTRYREDECLQALMGTIHETGHGRYEQHRPRAWLDQPVSRARSMAIHESQSLFFEMQLAGHPGFAAQLAPRLQAALGAQPAFEAGNLHRLLTRVQPGFIRVEADEMTYPAHILLRFDIEQALLAGQAEVEDIPALWDAGMQTLLGLDTRGNYRDGPMQDVHWPAGLLGYFPCYSLGAMYAAQWMATLRREQPEVEARIAAGDLAPVMDWLRDRVWSQGSRWSTDVLSQRISGETLNPAHFRAHLTRRYLS